MDFKKIFIFVNLQIISEPTIIYNSIIVFIMCIESEIHVLMFSCLGVNVGKEKRKIWSFFTIGNQCTYIVFLLHKSVSRIHCYYSTTHALYHRMKPTIAVPFTVRRKFRKYNKDFFRSVKRKSSMWRHNWTEKYSGNTFRCKCTRTRRDVLLE